MKDNKKMGGKKLSPIEAKAKTTVLERLKKEMSDQMGEKVSNLKKGFGKRDSDGEGYGTTSANNIIKNDDNWNKSDSNIEEAEEELGDDLDNDNEAGEPAAHVKKMQAMYDGKPDNGGSQANSEEDSEDKLDKKIKALLAKKESMRKG